MAKVEPEKRGRQVDIQSNKLGFEETKLAVEAPGAFEVSKAEAVLEAL